MLFTVCRLAENGEDTVSAGYPKALGPYTMSKILVSALTPVLQRELDKNPSRVDIIVNAVGFYLFPVRFGFINVI